MQPRGGCGCGCAASELGAKDEQFNHNAPPQDSMTSPRAFDHFVVPVPTLAQARARLSALGFTVAPDARHPFGTENCCVFFTDGTFIEPLAIGDAALVDAATSNGNVFTGNDRRFRDSDAPMGIAQLVIQTDDAEGDDGDYRAERISGGPLLNFGRTFTKPDGTSGEVAFRLAFAAAPGLSDIGFFACEVVKAAPGGRGALTSHANGALATVALLAVANDPLAMDDFLSFFLEAESDAGTEVAYQSANGALRILRPEFYELIIGLKPPVAHWPRMPALILGVETLDSLRAQLGANGVGFDERPGWIIVPPVPEFPLVLIFQEAE
jgi:Glyoxalase-like domain